MYAAKIVADSLAMGVRLTTFEVTFPRFILAEFNTHRVLARNSASSRAIPVERRISQVRETPFVPEAFSKNQRGMQASANLDANEGAAALIAWTEAREDALRAAERLSKLGVHKQHANRRLEADCWHTVVVTATEWSNFFALRCHPAAQPEMQITATLMREAMAKSTPEELWPGEWHLPYAFEVDGEEFLNDAALLAISVARCAAVSYERQSVEKPQAEYVKRHDELLVSGHMSPFEHQAMVFSDPNAPPFAPHYRFEASDNGPIRLFDRRGLWVEDGWFCGPLRAPFLQYRKMLPGEAVFAGS